MELMCEATNSVLGMTLKWPERKGIAMLITIGERTKGYMATLELKEYPFTEDELKTNFRMLLKKFHPDMGNGNKTKTVEIIEAYKELKNLAIIAPEQKQRKKMKSDDLFSLFVKCERCHGTGEVARTRFSGDPSFTTKVTQIPCAFCQGKKVYYPKGKAELSPCPHCHGWGTVLFRQRV